MVRERPRLETLERDPREMEGEGLNGMQAGGDHWGHSHHILVKPEDSDR